MRSGVPWIRLNSPPERVRQRLRQQRLAEAGTPCTSTCPWATSAMTSARMEPLAPTTTRPSSAARRDSSASRIDVSRGHLPVQSQDEVVKRAQRHLARGMRIRVPAPQIDRDPLAATRVLLSSTSQARGHAGASRPAPVTRREEIVEQRRAVRAAGHRPERNRRRPESAALREASSS